MSAPRPVNRTSTSRAAVSTRGCRARRPRGQGQQREGTRRLGLLGQVEGDQHGGQGQRRQVERRQRRGDAGVGPSAGTPPRRASSPRPAPATPCRARTCRARRRSTRPWCGPAAASGRAGRSPAASTMRSRPWRRWPPRTAAAIQAGSASAMSSPTSPHWADMRAITKAMQTKAMTVPASADSAIVRRGRRVGVGSPSTLRVAGSGAIAAPFWPRLGASRTVLAVAGQTDHDEQVNFRDPCVPTAPGAPEPGRARARRRGCRRRRSSVPDSPETCPR